MMRIYKSLASREIESFSSHELDIDKLKEGISLIKSAGYAGVELEDDLRKMSPDELSELSVHIKRESMELGLHVPTKFEYQKDGAVYRTSFNLCPDFNRESSEESRICLERYIEIAEILDAKYINTHIEGLYDEYVGKKIDFGYTPTEKDIQSAGEYWIGIGQNVKHILSSHLSAQSEIARKTPIEICVENHELSFHLSRPEDLDILNIYPAIAFLFDVGHPLKQLHNINSNQDWGLNKIGDKKVTSRYITSLRYSFDDTKKDNGLGLLKQYISKKAPKRAHLHQIDENGRDHQPVSARGIIDMQQIMGILKGHDAESFTVESFFKYPSKEAYFEGIKKELDLLTY